MLAWLCLGAAAVWTAWRTPNSRWLGLMARSMLWGYLATVVACGAVDLVLRLTGVVRQ